MHPPTASSSIAHLLGRSKPATAAPRTEKPKSHIEGLASNAAIAGIPLRAKVKATLSKPTAKTAKAAPTKAVKRKAAAASRYAHLQPAAYDSEADAAPAPTTSDKVFAAKIHAAAAKSRTPTGTGAPPPSGLAAQIIAAGKKRRGLA